MTIETIVREDVEQGASLDVDTSPDSHLAAAQFEAIIRTWKGEATGSERAIPLSPVGEADCDGSVAAAQLGILCPTLGCTIDCPTNQYSYCDPWCTLYEGTCRLV